jgi:hypothetical protein
VLALSPKRAGYDKLSIISHCILTATKTQEEPLYSDVIVPPSLEKTGYTRQTALGNYYDPRPR